MRHDCPAQTRYSRVHFSRRDSGTPWDVEASSTGPSGEVSVAVEAGSMVMDLYSLCQGVVDTLVRVEHCRALVESVEHLPCLQGLHLLFLH